MTIPPIQFTQVPLEPGTPAAAVRWDLGLTPRLWPGIVIVLLQWIAILAPRIFMPGSVLVFFAMFYGALVGATAIVLWWLFASRVRWRDRFLVLLFCVGTGIAARFLCHDSFGFSLILYGLPLVATVWVLWLVIARPLHWPAQRAGLLVALLLSWGACLLVRFDGIDGNFAADVSWRWAETAEDKLEAELAGRKAAPPPTNETLSLQPGDWPGFRGPARDGRLSGVKIPIDWTSHPPRQVWRQRVGPGWGSFAAIGTRLFTQEQRGQGEVVVCYDGATGSEIWAHEDVARFTEPVAGPGPRATPTFHEGKIYAMGADGLLNCLDAATGKMLWSRNIAADAGAKVPMWGFAASPLVAEGIVTVFAGAAGKCVLGYDALKGGEPLWAAGDGKDSYCSPHLARVDGVSQVLICTDVGLTAFHPVRGEVLWQHAWPLNNIARIVQPAILDDGDMLVGAGFNQGTHRLRVHKTAAGWTDREVWTTKAINPYFNDLVVHRGHLYGFDGIFFTCLNLDAGEKRWRERGYGAGQVLLLADQDLLLILSEKGEAVLMEANPNDHKVLGRFQAIVGKTWNHPVVAHGRLFVRNGEEAACYRLSRDE